MDVRCTHTAISFESWPKDSLGEYDVSGNPSQSAVNQDDSLPLFPGLPILALTGYRVSR